jgi:predicted DNA-binding protein (MmcQ/YjbR family)
MTKQSLLKLTRDWPGVSAEIKWEDDLIFMVAGKMFCGLCVSGVEKGKFSFKVEAERFLELTDRPGFRPAPYMARAHWVTLDDSSVVPQDELKQFIRRAYELVFAKLTRKQQRALTDIA